MENTQPALLAEVVRSGFVESRHRGSVHAITPSREDAFAIGATGVSVFWRSCLKPLQAVAVLETGVVDKYGLTSRHIALACASHSGEGMHVDGVRDLLNKADVPESALGCPHELPLDEVTARTLIARGLQPARILNNCSGKHAAFLAACAASGWPLSGYLDPLHPLQLVVRAKVEQLCGELVFEVGVDGCGAPVFALSLAAIARGFLALATAPADSPEGVVAAAVRDHPELIGGTRRDVTRLLGAVPGLVAKDGAEGCFVAAHADSGAVAVKIEDGTGRARTPVLVAALRRLGVTGDSDALDALAVGPVLGGGEPVGEVRAVLP